MPEGDLDREHRDDAARVHAGALPPLRIQSAAAAEAAPSSPFRRAWWLPGAHLQTVWGHFTRPRVLLPHRREWLATPDGDAIALDHVDAESPDAPRLLVLHGLEGSSFSVYVQGLLALAHGRGLAGTAVNFRSCARHPGDLDRWLPSRAPRLYHSGETSDLDWVVRSLKARSADSPLLAAGISLGGNVLLKWLGEHPDERLIDAAATISAPYDLAAGARFLENTIGRLYARHFLPTLIEKVEELLARHPALRERGVDLERARAARDFHPFDDAATAPIHGFIGADDYYERSSSRRFASRITTPTLCLSAEDDPFLPRSAVREFRNLASKAVELHVTPYGGHVGFVAGRHPRRADYWAERHAFDWLLRHLPAPD